jgi:predicted alpha/beta hydrolase
VKIQAEDGWELELELEEAVGEPIAVAVLGHAMMVDRRSMDRPAGEGFASTLRRAGIRVIRFDARGHGGAATPPAGRELSWTYDELVRLDLPAVVAHAREISPGLPLGVIGHSLFGHVAMASAGTEAHAQPPDWHVLMAANTWMPSLEPSRLRRVRKGLQVSVMRAITASVGHFPSRRVRMGPADEARPYIQDISGFWTRDRWGSRDGVDYLAAARLVRGPVLSVLGEGDALLAHPEGARRWASHIGEAGAEVWRVGVGTHGLNHDPDHMGLVTDLRCRPLWEAIGGWVEEVIASLRVE